MTFCSFFGFVQQIIIVQILNECRAMKRIKQMNTEGERQKKTKKKRNGFNILKENNKINDPNEIPLHALHFI